MKIEEMDDELSWTWITEKNLIFTTKVIYVIWAILSLLSAFSPIPYGRYFNSVKFNGRVVRAQYVWHILFLIVLSPILIMIFTPSRMLSSFPNVVAISMFLIHYVHRSIIYPIKYLANASPLPIQSFYIALVAILHGSIHGFYLSNMHRVPDVGLLSVIGLILNVGGLVINVTHDRILAQLRKPQNKQDQGSKSITKNAENRKKYSIPRGGLFEYVSAANYFGEIVEWWGWALFSRGFPQVAFALLSTITIGIRGWQHHQFYKRVFGKAYPVKRRAVIPFIL